MANLLNVSPGWYAGHTLEDKSNRHLALLLAQEILQAATTYRVYSLNFYAPMPAYLAALIRHAVQYLEHPTGDLNDIINLVAEFNAVLHCSRALGTPLGGIPAWAVAAELYRRPAIGTAIDQLAADAGVVVLRAAPEQAGAGEQGDHPRTTSTESPSQSPPTPRPQPEVPRQRTRTPRKTVLSLQALQCAFREKASAILACLFGIAVVCLAFHLYPSEGSLRLFQH